MSLKVMTIVGTRPEVIKLSRVIAELDKYTEHILVHTGQNYDYELNEIFFRELEIRRPDITLSAAGKTAAETVGNVITLVDAELEKVKPDALLMLGDTNSCLAAISAKRRKIPVFHMEAGNRCFDERVPEEINRRIVDHISDINMPYTEHARRYLIAEGIKAETIIKTGSPMKEVLDHYMPGIDKSDVMDRLQLKNGNYFLLSVHREENVDSAINFQALIETLNAVAARYDKLIVASIHPRTRKKIEEIGTKNLDKRIHLLKPLSFYDYIKLQKNAFCVLSDSGTITEESSILNIPAITIRQAHERPEGMDEGTLIMSGLGVDSVIRSIDIVTSQYSREDRRFQLVGDYSADNVSQKVLRIIMSYTDYINRTVWRK